MDRIGELFRQICQEGNWKVAWLKAIRGKRNDPAVRRFATDLEANLDALKGSFRAGTFRFGSYHFFTIRDPKPRVIAAVAFPERIAQHAIMNVLDPLFDSYQIFDSYACRRGKGTHAAVHRVLSAARYKRSFLKMDVRKYFDSIDHDILKSKLRRRVTDRHIIHHMDAIIDSYQTAPGKGIPIGNLTSQYFANHVLAYLDHYAKETLKAHVWIRYMDDIVALSSDTTFLHAVYDGAETYARDRLHLQLKPKILDSCDKGVPFLGFLVRPTGIYLARRSKTRFVQAIRNIDYGLRRGQTGQGTASCRATSVVAATTLARSLAFRQNVLYGFVPGVSEN